MNDRNNVLLQNPAFSRERLMLEKLTSCNVSIIKFYDFYLFKYIHWYRPCNKFQGRQDNDFTKTECFKF